MRIDIVSDTVCPWCYIGKQRLEKALDGVDGPAPGIAWHPFQLNPDMPPSGMPRRDYLELKFGGPERAGRAYEAVTRLAAAECPGVDFAAIERTPNTLDSHRLIRYAAETAGAAAQGAVVDALFRAYFEAAEDIGDPSVLGRVAGACGLDGDTVRAWIESGEDAELVLEADGRFRAMGLRGVPLFIVDGRYALSGAQEPEVFRQVFAAAREAALVPS